MVKCCKFDVEKKIINIHKYFSEKYNLGGIKIGKLDLKVFW